MTGKKNSHELTMFSEILEEALEVSELEVSDPELGPSEVSPKIRRRRRRTHPRSKTIAMKRMTHELRVGAAIYSPVDIPRPSTRAECREEMRPCPWVACKHHLYLDINPETGSIKINFPNLEPWELQHTCALDVADLGGITPDEIGEIMNLTRERVRQVEVRGLLKLKMGSPSPDEFGAELLAGRPPMGIEDTRSDDGNVIGERETQAWRAAREAFATFGATVEEHHAGPASTPRSP